MAEERHFSVLAWCGVAGPAVCTVTTVWAGLARRGYSPRRDSISHLGTGPHAALVNTTFVVFGLLMVGFAVALRASLHTRLISRLQATLFALCGLALAAAGLFPTDPAPLRTQTLHADIHDVAFVVVVVTLTAASVLLGASLWRERRAYALYSLLSGVAAAALLTLFLAMGDGWTWKGLAERAFMAVQWLWVVTLAYQVGCGGEPARSPATYLRTVARSV